MPRRINVDQHDRHGEVVLNQGRIYGRRPSCVRQVLRSLVNVKIRNQRLHLILFVWLLDVPTCLRLVWVIYSTCRGKFEANT